MSTPNRSLRQKIRIALLQTLLWSSVGSALFLAAPACMAQQPVAQRSASPRSVAQPKPPVSGHSAPNALPTATANKLRALLANPALRDARIGLCIVALGTAKSSQLFAVQPYAGGSQPTLWERDSESRFMPASNLKLYTAALALRQLGASRTFKTRIVAGDSPKDGVLDGDLQLVGGGDPSLTSRTCSNWHSVSQPLASSACVEKLSATVRCSRQRVSVDATPTAGRWMTRCGFTGRK
jgi:hypothetical protein